MSDPGVNGHRPMRVLQVSASDRMGGAEKVAWALLDGCRARGHRCWIAVGERHGGDGDVVEIPNARRRHLWARTCRGAAAGLGPVSGVRGAKRAQSLIRDWLGEPVRTWRRSRGREDFEFPGTAELLDLPAEPVDLVHCHNLHSPAGYFDLRQLPAISRRVPVVLTLHDAWLLSGHCAHSLGCDRWTSGCGTCPDLSIYPAVARDQTAFNWARKRAIFEQCRLYVATPSRWLMDKVERSMLRPAVIEARVIPNAVDLSVFTPGDRDQACAELGLPAGSKILLLTANGIRNNVFKDWRTMREAVGRVAQRLCDQEVLFIALGEGAPAETIGRAVVRFVPFEPDERKVAQYYRAADLYVHAAREDTFPITVLEALACGRPVVASAVGGIPEQIDEGVTGRLVRPGDADALAGAIVSILTNAALRREMADAAATRARPRFDLNRQVEAYLDWYQTILATHGRSGIAMVRKPGPAGFAGR